MLRPASVIIFTSLILIAADKGPVKPATSGNEIVDIIGTAIVDKADVTHTLGIDPGVNLIVVNVTVKPHGDNNVKIWLDDFTLLSNKDGQRSQPMAPTQIAGSASLRVSSSGDRGIGGGIMSNSRGPMWGGAPGTGTRPRRIGGDGEAVTSGGDAETKTTVATAGKAENPVLGALKEKILPEKETNEPVSGLLYFIFDGKHKIKDLELMYKSPAGRLILDFQR